MKDTIYVTTPIYYVNDVPHIGHAYTTIAADVYARYWRSLGKKVFFLTGTDEHGQKIAENAKKNEKDPKTFTDEIVDTFKNVWKVLDIQYDGFIRTTDDIHKKTVQKIFEIMHQKGDIYKGTYQGWYCVSCETYFFESDLDDPEIKKCPDCSRDLNLISEESYFFRLSKYHDELLKYYNDNPSFLAPSFRSKEMIHFIKSGLKDISVSRTAVKWGIPVPFDPAHSVYVWFDALINYISAIGYLDHLNEKTEQFTSIWPADVHLIGKEIFKFHTVIWPAMLLSLGLPLPKEVFGHGWWTVEGEKMSKSKGNVVDPVSIAESFGADAFRYFVLREVQFGNDGDFSMNNFVFRYNADLANDMGNLLSRTLSMTNCYCNGLVPDCNTAKNILWDKSSDVFGKYTQAMETLRFSDALMAIGELSRTANKYIEDTAPWKLAKDEAKTNELKNILFNLLATLRLVTIWLAPYMPQAAKQMQEQLGLSDTDMLSRKWEDMPQKKALGKPSPLFPRKDPPK